MGNCKVLFSSIANDNKLKTLILRRRFVLQEWTNVYSSSGKTLTEFNRHLYSGGYQSNKIQKWKVSDIDPLSITQSLSPKKRG